MKPKIFLLVLLFPLLALGQTQTTKDVNVQTQSWFALNTTFRLDENWSILADAQMRRSQFLSQNNFNIVRTGLAYDILPGFATALGYAHLWVAPSNSAWSTIANENRIYQQALYSTKLGNVTLVHRLRNEQRWQDIIVNDQKTGDLRFTNRVRYQLGCTIPLSKKASVPSIVVSDEILFQFGKDVVYNTFDQNRIFVGIRQALSPTWSYDFGYMQVYQQKSSGFQYDQNHTLRLFFYYNKGLRKKEMPPNHSSGDE